VNFTNSIEGLGSLTVVERTLYRCDVHYAFNWDFLLGEYE
jgi:hypothetical protein